MKKIILVLCIFVSFYSGVSAGTCFPKHTVYEINGVERYSRYNWLMENAFSFPVFSIEKPKQIWFSYKWKDSCWSLDISEIKRLYPWNFSFLDSILLMINISIVLLFYFLPIIYFINYAIRQKEYKIIKILAVFSFCLLWSLPYFFFYLRL